MNTAQAFFKISRSSVTKRSWRSSCRIPSDSASLAWPVPGNASSLAVRWFYRHRYSKATLIPRSSAISLTVFFFFKRQFNGINFELLAELATVH